MNKSSLSKSVAWYGIGNMFVRSLSFFLLPLYSNLLSTEDYGNYSLLISLYAIAGVLYMSGLQNGLTKFYLEDENSERKKKTFSSIFNSVVILGVMFTFLSFIFSKEISKLILGTELHGKLIMLVFLTLNIESLSYIALHLLKTKEQAKRVVFNSGVSGVVNLLLNILFIFYLRMNIAGIFLAQFLSSFLLLIITFPSILPELQLTFDKPLLKKIFLFSLPFVISGLFSSAVDVSDRFILNIFTNKEQVGIYSLSYKIAMVMNVFVISFRTAWLPHAMNIYNSQNYAEVFGNTFKKLIAASLFILLVVSFFSPVLFEIKLYNFYVINKSYESGLVILPYVLLGYLFNGIASFYSVYPNISSKSYHFLYSDLYAFFVNLLLNILLIPLIGIIGAAVATSFAFFTAALYLFLISKEKIKINYQLKEMAIVIFFAFLFLWIGMSVKNYLLNIALIILYLILNVRILKISITKLFRIA